MRNSSTAGTRVTGIFTDKSLKSILRLELTGTSRIATQKQLFRKTRVNTPITPPMSPYSSVPSPSSSSGRKSRISLAKSKINTLHIRVRWGPIRKHAERERKKKASELQRTDSSFALTGTAPHRMGREPTKHTPPNECFLVHHQCCVAVADSEHHHHQ